MMMIVDAHYHLDLRLESVERLVAQMRVHRIDRVALIASVCDPLHVGPLGRRFVQAMRRALSGAAPGLGRLLYWSTVTRGGRASFLGSGAAIYQRPDNGAVERAMAAHPDRFVSWWFVNPRVPGAVTEAERGLLQPGFIGVKAHPFWHRYPVAALDDVAALCQELNKPILVHLGAGAERGDFRRLPNLFPRLRVVYAHAGIPWYGALWDFVARRENVFVDLSSPYLDKALRYRALRALGAARCLYGSDGPYGYPAPDGGYDHGAILGQIERSGLPAQDLERVLGGNFVALTAT
jgi:predicted TIM-barrel fold metal-dependent hydrolase